MSSLLPPILCAHRSSLIGDRLAWKLPTIFTPSVTTSTLCRSKTRFRVRSLGILVDHSVEDVSTSYPHGGQIRDQCGGHVKSWRALFTALMWPVFVVVPDVLVECGEQVSRVVDQDPVQAFPAGRAYPPLGIRVRAEAPGAVSARFRCLRW
jgi:hypothetical protein